jgi:hypothetical protein
MVNSWSARYRARLSAPHDTVDSVDAVDVASRGDAGACVNSVNSVTAERDADGATERAAIQAELILAPLGSPERKRLEKVQRATLAGLMAAARLKGP